MKYQKISSKVMVTFAKESGVLQTLEGLVSYLAGDALLIGNFNERWPIKRQNFEDTYLPISPVTMGVDGGYYKKRIIVDAYQCSTETKIEINGGQALLHAKPGDWVISDSSGNKWVVADEIFSRNYMPIDLG